MSPRPQRRIIANCKGRIELIPRSNRQGRELSRHIRTDVIMLAPIGHLSHYYVVDTEMLSETFVNTLFIAGDLKDAYKVNNY